MEEIVELVGKQVRVAFGDKKTPRIVESIFSIMGSDGNTIKGVYSLAPKDAISAGYSIMSRGIIALIESLFCKK